jgi:hypothetical protein
MGNEMSKKDRRNYVYLSAREHYVCHWLLTKFTTGEAKYKLICGFWRMCNVNGLQDRQSSRYVEKAKRLHSAANSERMKGKNIRKKPITKEDREKMRGEGNRLAEYMKANPELREKLAKQRSETMKGKMPCANSLKNLRSDREATKRGLEKSTMVKRAFGEVDMKIETPECCFFTYQQAADFYGIAPTNIRKRLTRKNPPVGWRYVK